MHLSHIVKSLWFSLLTVAVLPSFASAQNAKQAATDLAQADEDFAIQGEYSGQVVENSALGFQSKKYGLQVVAQGGGQFIAALYAGGLPGSGWDRQTKYPLKGQRAADGVELAGEGLSV